MKNPLYHLFVLLVIISFTFSSVHAQTEGFEGGLFFNANGIHFAGDNEIFWQSSRGKVWGGGGLSGGLFVKRNINEKIHLGLELRYIQKGSVFEYVNDFGTRSVETMRLDYVEVPVLVGYSFQINKRSFIAETGLAFGRQIASKLHINDLTNQNEIPNINNFSNDDLSWIGNLNFPINEKNKNNLLLGLRFSYSLKSIHNYYNLRNMVYGIQINYLINPW